jgi:Domain of unknown function (DUF6048)
MKQQHIFIYSIKTFLMLLFCVSATAQNDSVAKPINDSIKVKEKYGLRVGVDIGKFIRSYLDDEYSGLEIQGDFRLKKKLYIAGELGLEEKNDVTNYLDITTKGTYLKAGIDYNMYQNWLDMDNMIYSGFRVGASAFSHTLNSYQTYNTNQYWPTQFSSNQPQEFNDLTAIWVELILGIKAELFNNLFMGINVQLKGLVSQTEPENFTNIYIPGFNKTFDSSKIGVGYGYTISYRIPLYKKDK